MKLKVLGAAGEVTGSNYLLETEKSRVLIDCGMHQGRDEDRRNREPFPYEADSVDAVVLTHAHMDHSGRIPLLVREGFKGEVFATPPTADLCEVMWEDASHLMREEAEWHNRKNARRGLPPIEPLYGDQDVEAALGRFRLVPYDEIVHVTPDIQIRFRDAGHILGSSIVEVWLGDGRDVKVVFSGDLGPQRTVLEKNPATIEDADFVVIESTYGDRLHRSNEETRQEFREVVLESLTERGKVLIPTFVVDRAQRVLYELKLFQEEEAGKFQRVPIYFDSPMGAKTTQIYRKYSTLLSSEIQEVLRSGDDPFTPDYLRIAKEASDSQRINAIPTAIVLAGNGMCNGGRIVHHLKNNLWRENCHVVFVGFQAQGTVGRRLVDGAKAIRVAGEEVKVKAKLHTINGFSAHADKKDLLAWASNFKTGPLFLVTHGEPASSGSLAEALKGAGSQAVVPTLGQEFDLVQRGRTYTPPAPEERGRLIDQRAQLASLLIEITNLATSLQEEVVDLEQIDEAAALLQSTKTLLSAASKLKKRAKEEVPV